MPLFKRLRTNCSTLFYYCSSSARRWIMWHTTRSNLCNFWYDRWYHLVLAPLYRYDKEWAISLAVHWRILGSVPKMGAGQRLLHEQTEYCLCDTCGCPIWDHTWTDTTCYHCQREQADGLKMELVARTLIRVLTETPRPELYVLLDSVGGIGGLEDLIADRAGQDITVAMATGYFTIRVAPDDRPPH